MKLQLDRVLRFCMALAFIALCSSTVSADFTETFTSDRTELFTFGAYEGNFSFTADGIDINVPASGDSFGGLGVAPLAEVDLSMLTSIEVVARLDAGNADDLVLSVREGDGMGGQGEFFSFTIAQSEFTQGSFVTVVIDPTSQSFNGDMTDGVLNGELRDTGFQSTFGNTANQFFTVQSVTYVGATSATAVPEPSSAGILLGLCSLLVSRRRRRSKASPLLPRETT